MSLKGESAVKEMIFDVVLGTPIGKRNGVVYLYVKDNNIVGKLEIFGGEFELYGMMFDDKNCELYGMFKTLFNEFYYKAVGQIADDKLNLVMKGSSKKYKLEGVRRNSGE